MGVETGEWLALLRSDYLEGYVREGGAAVKFAVVQDRAAGTILLSEVERQAASLDYVVARIDAAQVKVHLMQDLFHEVARKVPWRDLARQFVRESYRDLGIEATDDDLTIERVAAASRRDQTILNVELRRKLEELLANSKELGKDFRIAMLWLCLAELNRPRGDSADAQAILDWLTGDLRLVSAVKRLLIFRKIGRHNARAMLSSLGSWCRLAGRPGLVLALDIRQLMRGKRTEVGPEERYYTPAAVLDAYEVLRQLIDSTDDISGVFCVVLAEPGLFDDERRGVRVYKALYERIWPDVRLRQRPNPLSSLAQLGDVTGA